MPSSRSAAKPKHKPLHQWSFTAIGAPWTIELYSVVNDSTALQAAVADLIAGYDRTFSRFRSDSLVTAISKSAGQYEFPAEAARLFELYRHLYGVTNGLVTPLIGQLMSDAGYDADYRLQPGELRQVPAWDDVMSFDGGVLTTRQPVLLDFGAAGKGYLVDLVASLLESRGVARYVIDASGDMRLQGLVEPQRIGMQLPGDDQQVIGVIKLPEGALCASAADRRRWDGYHHIMDPQRLTSVDGVVATWVQAVDCAVADGLATALFFVSPAQLQLAFLFEYAVLYADGSMQRSAEFPAEVFIAEVPDAT